MSEAILQLRNIGKKFGARQVLTGVNFSFFPGKIYGLVGPSGAGKSTLLRILDFLEEPTEGRVFYRGKPVMVGGSNCLAVRRRIGMVFQQPVLFSTSVLENVFYGLKIRGQNFNTNRERLLEVLQMVGLEGLEKQKATTLSGGEAQRLALARVLVLQPEVLLLDEPTANLDPANIMLMEKLLRDIREKLGTTLIMVTHNLLQAKRLVDEVLMIYDGRLIEAQPVGKIFSDPEHPVTKSFVSGEMVY